VNENGAPHRDRQEKAITGDKTIVANRLGTTNHRK
jgi:hypothetical protein